jgi:hypothetical protein
MLVISSFRVRVLAALAWSVLAVASAGRSTLKADIPQPPYQAGTSYWGSSGNGTWIQYIAGDLPVIFSSGTRRRNRDVGDHWPCGR